MICAVHTDAEGIQSWTSVRSPRDLAPGATRDADWYCLIRLMTNPVVMPGAVFGDSVVGRWATSVVGKGDEQHLYLLLRVWHMQEDDPRLREDLYQHIVRLWNGQQPGFGLLTKIVLSTFVLGGLPVSIVWMYPLGIAIVWVLLAGVIIASRIRKIRQYFPDFPRAWAKP